MVGSGVLSAKGIIKPLPFAIAVTAIYVVNLVVSNYLSLGFLARGGVIPFLLLQVALTRLWYTLHAKRLADAGRSGGFAKFIAMMFFVFISFVALIAMGSQPPPQASQTETTLGGAISLILFAFLLTGSGFGGLGYYFAALVAIPLFVVLLVFGYSGSVGMRPSLKPELLQAS
jgi:uncharacterized membrane protein YhaH (DUF805 family)